MRDVSACHGTDISSGTSPAENARTGYFVEGILLGHTADLDRLTLTGSRAVGRDGFVGHRAGGNRRSGIVDLAQEVC